jgi:hypothetical protein
LKLRAFGGAGLSFGDMISDAYMINTFYMTGKRGTANGLLAMVGSNLAIQALIVWGQTHGLKKRKWRTMITEIISVVTFVKPGVDAFRVASGAEQVPGSVMTPLHEMVYTKGGELVFEAIPGWVREASPVIPFSFSPLSASQPDSATRRVAQRQGDEQGGSGVYHHLDGLNRHDGDDDLLGCGRGPRGKKAKP